MHWKFNEVKCLLLPAPEQPLSSSLGAFPSFPEGTQPVPKLPGAYGSLHNLTSDCWSSSRAQLLGQQQGRQLCKPTGLAGPPRSSPGGRSRSYSPPGYGRTLRGQARKGQTLQAITFNTEHARRGFGGGFWGPSKLLTLLILIYIAFFFFFTFASFYSTFLIFLIYPSIY